MTLSEFAVESALLSWFGSFGFLAESIGSAVERKT
jgi:hypothetical protein